MIGSSCTQFAFESFAAQIFQAFDLQILEVAVRNALLQDPWMRFCHAHIKLCWQSCLSPDEKQQNEKFLLVSDEVGVVPAMQKPPFQRGRLNVEADLCTFFFSLSLYVSLFGLNKCRHILLVKQFPEVSAVQMQAWRLVVLVTAVVWHDFAAGVHARSFWLVVPL